MRRHRGCMAAFVRRAGQATRDAPCERARTDPTAGVAAAPLSTRRVHVPRDHGAWRRNSRLACRVGGVGTGVQSSTARHAARVHCRTCGVGRGACRDAGASGAFRRFTPARYGGVAAANQDPASRAPPVFKLPGPRWPRIPRSAESAGVPAHRRRRRCARSRRASRSRAWRRHRIRPSRFRGWHPRP